MVPQPVRSQSSASNLRLDAAKTESELRRFLDLALASMQLELTYNIALATAPAGDADVAVDFDGPDCPLLLDRQAELLIALEYIAHRWLRLDPRQHDHVRFDCGEFRATRLEELKLSARVAAQRVRETGQQFRFNPMSARERRILHLELTCAPGVRTSSDGAGERRHVIIYPATPNLK
jgi:spoIIIJ-associated protein